MTVSSLQIELRSMRFYAYHGVMEQERRVGGQFTVDLTLTLDSAASAAVELDDLAATVNYAEAYDVVRNIMETPSALIEHVAGRILRALFDTFPLIASATVTVCKDAPPIPGFDGKGCAVTLKGISG